MPSTTDKIKQAAARNQELITILSQTDHAHAQLEQQDRYLSDLTGEIAQTRKVVDDLDRKRKKELKEHASYRDSVMKRFAYKAVGKKNDFAAKADKEETEYFEALQEEHKAQELLKGREGALQDAQAAREEIAAQARRHDQAQLSLDAMYEAIFDGPSPGFPAEDAAEEDRRRARENYTALRSRTEAQRQAMGILRQAELKMDSALRSMYTALQHSRRDMWGGGSLTDMMERNALSRAEVLATEARLAVAQARRFDPHVGTLPRVRVPQGDILTDIFFDNVFTDMMFHDKIKAAVREMRQARGVLESMVGEARARGAQLEADVTRMQVALEKARLDLQKIREREFARVLGQETGGGGGSSGSSSGDGGGSVVDPVVTGDASLPPPFSSTDTPPPAFTSVDEGHGNRNNNRASNNPFWQ